jgi:membrane protease YdiL (CAAX protease family)
MDISRNAPDAVADLRLRKLSSITIAAALALAFHFSYFSEYLSQTMGLITHTCLVPITGVIVLRRPFPTIAVSAAHLRVLGLAIVSVAGMVLGAAFYGFENSYTHWDNALIVAFWVLLFIVLILRYTTPAPPARGYSGWWFFVLVAGVLLILSTDYCEECGALRNAVTNFIFIGMAEELMFRGVIQGYLSTLWSEKWLGISRANWITSLLFAWIHNWTFSPDRLPWLLYLIPCGILFGLVRDRTGGWLASGIAHGLIIPILQLWLIAGVIKPWW